jgi:ABC-type multidrug transport system ATPase subunit
MDEVEQVCDHVTIIHEGLIVARGTPESLAAQDNVVEIQCERAEDAAALLSENPDIIKAERTGPDRVEVLAPEVRAGRINQMLVDHGITADQILVRRESLEQVFFRLTGRVDGGAANGGDAQ